MQYVFLQKKEDPNGTLPHLRLSSEDWSDRSSDALKALHPAQDPNLLVGFETCDDAAVYRLSDNIAFISTVDFITPPVDDPYWFGQIAAANALSDVYC